MKNFAILAKKGFLIAIILFSNAFISTGTSTHITLGFANCIEIDTATIRFNITITNDSLAGDTTLSFNSVLFRMIYSAGIKTGTPTISLTYFGNSDFPASFVGSPSTSGAYNITSLTNGFIIFRLLHGTAVCKSMRREAHMPNRLPMLEHCLFAIEPIATRS